MLYEFLTEHKKEIIGMCQEKVFAAGESKPTSELLEQGLPIFYNELINVLQRTALAGDKTTPEESTLKEGNAAAHGKESLRLGYSISQVVHAYGAVCQSITAFVQTKSYKITPREFQDLNLSLDCAIAEAVTEFEKAQSDEVIRCEVERMGFLIHEMGNALAAASVAYQMIQKGHVGSAGITSKVLSSAHERMRYLIEGALTEVRLRGHAVIEQTSMRLLDLATEVELSAKIMGKLNEVDLRIEIDPQVEVSADRRMVFSALSNLVNNAMKFTKKYGLVTVRGRKSNERVLIEVEDECGGLPDGEIESLFTPFVQKGSDKTGMGLGLSLSRKAIELNQGKLTARNIAGKGCVFTIDLPGREAKAQNAA